MSVRNGTCTIDITVVQLRDMRATHTPVALARIVCAAAAALNYVIVCECLRHTARNITQSEPLFVYTL